MQLLLQFGNIWQLEGAIRELLLAQRLNPSVGHVQLGTLYSHLGLEKPALRELQRALEIDPTSETNQDRLVEAYVFLGKSDDAIAASSHYFGGSGRSASSASWALPYLWKNRVDDAEQEISQALARDSTDPLLRSSHALLLARRGRFQEAEAEMYAILEDAEKLRSYHHATYDCASVYALWGKAELAVKWLRRTTDVGLPNYPLFACDPHLDQIRNDPFFLGFMAELKLQWETYKREFG